MLYANISMSKLSSSVNLPFLLSKMGDYMFTQKNISEIAPERKLEDTSTASHTHKIKHNTKHATKHTKKVNDTLSMDTSFFIPSEKDTLFWCFYIMQYGLSNYEMLFQHTFKEEKAQKIKMVELIREHKELLKANKWKRAQMEDDLVNQPVISVNTFLCLCAIHTLNIMIISQKRCYSNRTENKNTYIIEQNDDTGYGLYVLDEASLQNKILFYEKTCWLIEKWDKPLKAISHYKIKILQEICKKLDLPIEYKMDNGLVKRIKKKDRQEMINKMKLITPNYTEKLDKIKMRNLYRDSIFVPNGRGNIKLDCFRLYEASLCGAIPIVVGSKKEIEGTFCQEENPPWLMFENWDEAQRKCLKLLKDMDNLNKLSQKNINWWSNRLLKLRELISVTLK